MKTKRNTSKAIDPQVDWTPSSPPSVTFDAGVMYRPNREMRVIRSVKNKRNKLRLVLVDCMFIYDEIHNKNTTIPTKATSCRGGVDIEDKEFSIHPFFNSESLLSFTTVAINFSLTNNTQYFLVSRNWKYMFLELEVDNTIVHTCIYYL